MTELQGGSPSVSAHVEVSLSFLDDKNVFDRK
jgi:hypothetical protein